MSQSSTTCWRSPTSTTPPDELIDFAEAAGPFMEPAPGRTLRIADRYTLVAEHGHTWAAVERIRLRSEDVSAAFAEVDAFLHETGTRRASWWLTERSTPDDLEERLLACGAVRDDADYLHGAMVLTREPPRVDGVEVRAVSTLEEFAEARRLTLAAFHNPHMQPPTEDEIAAEWAQQVDPTFAAYLDGRMASVGRVVYTRVGGYLMGGSTAAWARGRGAYRAVVRARWDGAVERGTPALAVGAGSMSRPILERLGFVHVLEFRRIESVRSPRGSREQLEQLEASDLDIAVALAWLVRDDVGLDADQVNAARRRAMFVLAAGGDPHRDLRPNDVAAARLADELDTPARRRALDAALATFDTRGLPNVGAAVRSLRAEPDRAWRTLALALLADELAE